MARTQGMLKLYSDQSIYVGIDVHKKKWSVCIIQDFEIIGQFTIDGTFHALKKLLTRYTGCEIFSVYEAGFLGFSLHYKLTDLGIHNIIVAPNKLPVEVGNLVKTDRRDCKKLALKLSKGDLKGNHIPAPDDLNARQLGRLREQTKRKRQRAMHQIKMLLHQYGHTFRLGLGKEMRGDILALELSDNVRLSIEIFIDQIEVFEKQMKLIMEKIKSECAREKYRENYRILQTVPGIGKTIAACMCFEIGDFSRFSTGSKLTAFLGLTPREFSSGEHVRRGRITGQGNPWLRSMLVEAAWKAKSKDKAIEEFYNRVLSQSGSGKKAIVAVARKLVGRMHSIIVNQQDYVVGVAA